MNRVREIFETMDYGPAPEAEDVAESFLETHRRTFYPFVNGRFARFIDECYFD